MGGEGGAETVAEGGAPDAAPPPDAARRADADPPESVPPPLTVEEGGSGGDGGGGGDDARDGASSSSSGSSALAHVSATAEATSDPERVERNARLVNQLLRLGNLATAPPLSKTGPVASVERRHG
jgi:hypothetical protein